MLTSDDDAMLLDEATKFLSPDESQQTYDNDDCRSLTQWWINERFAPELLPYQGDFVANLMEMVEAQVMSWFLMHLLEKEPMQLGTLQAYILVDGVLDSKHRIHPHQHTRLGVHGRPLPARNGADKVRPAELSKNTVGKSGLVKVRIFF